MRVEVTVLGSPSLICLMVSVDVKQHLKKRRRRLHRRENKDPHTETKQTERGSGAQRQVTMVTISMMVAGVMPRRSERNCWATNSSAPCRFPTLA